ncbi:hypothetical protein EIN_057230 [Entamoeba invadens IP1]|uniref:hypothetical protein n=1 Tax=Entamoeba invadens IP1 TaxID=370355 RepID=UPI0002C3E0ED|nr:hypothetical protein EIN_057230 [Entamoeba invadens IP1]ELP93338.1 hypothetical protein EIN_057230 [Entamoeba invadens IP1]|eukprot:XP_004260109.1 hypothetical protein EIN_057230 [Entamoeba invadens IP1]
MLLLFLVVTALAAPKPNKEAKAQKKAVTQYKKTVTDVLNQVKMPRVQSTSNFNMYPRQYGPLSDSMYSPLSNPVYNSVYGNPYSYSSMFRPSFNAYNPYSFYGNKLGMYGGMDIPLGQNTQYGRHHIFPGMKYGMFPNGYPLGYNYASYGFHPRYSRYSQFVNYDPLNNPYHN